MHQSRCFYILEVQVLTRPQLQELIEAGGYVVCRVTGWRDNVFFMPLVQTAANWLAFACGQDWNKGTSEYIHVMLWIKSSGAIEFLLDET